jgi:HK97 family phage portal protein
LGIFDRIFNRDSRKAAQNSSPYNDRSFGPGGRVKSLNDLNSGNMSEYSGQTPWVSIAVDKVVGKVATQKHSFFDDNDEQIETRRLDESIYLPFDMGWAGLSFQDIIKFCIPNLLMLGNAFIWKTTGTAYGKANGLKDSFIPLPTSVVKVVMGENNLHIKEYEINFGNGVVFKVDKEDMIHLKQNTVFNPFVGVGTLSKGRILFEGEVAASEYVNSFLSEAKHMPLSTVIDKTSRTDDDIERAQAMLKQKYSDKIMYMNGEDISITHSSLIQKDFNFIEMRRDDRQTTLSLFGVPPIVAGIPDSTNRANGREQFNGFLEHTINPLLEDISDQITRQHVALIDKSVKFKYDLHTVYSIDYVIKKLNNGIITPNRASQLCGEEPDYTDETRDQYYLPSSLYPMGFVEPSETESDDQEDEEGNDEPGKSYDKMKDIRNYKLIVEDFKRRSRKAKKFQAKYLVASLKSRLQVEDRYVGRISKYFEAQEKRVIEKVREVLDKADGGKIENLDASYIFSLPEEEEILSDEIISMHTSGVQKAIKDINGIVGSAVNYNTSNPMVVTMISAIGKKVTGKIQESTIKELQRLIVKGVDEDWNIVQFQDAIQGKFKQFQGYRARMIARTEARAAWDAGAVVSYEELGVKTVDVVGCTKFEPDSDCGKQGIPLQNVASLRFHPNHIGSILPSEEI